MRKIGLIGGLSWTSTARYYEIINQAIHKVKGGFHSAPLLVESLDFADVARCATQDDWDCASSQLIGAAARLEAAGAEALLICANSMHKVYERVQDAVKVPIIHIAEVVGAKMKADGIKTAALIGTRNVMLESFYRQKLISRDIELLPPEMPIVETLDRIIYDELLLGKASRQAERELKTIITNLEQDGAEAVVLGCTELEMVVDVDANVLPIYDCTRIHAEAAVAWILG